MPFNCRACIQASSSNKLHKVFFNKYKYLNWLIVGILFSFLLHVPTISNDIQGIHSWRQSQTMWCIRNFVRSDANILNPRTSMFNKNDDNIHRYEFPILQWPIAMIQRVFGEKIEIVRLIMFLVGAFAVIGMYFIIKQITADEFTAITTAFLFQFSPVFYYYTFTPVPDILALTSSIWFIYFMLKFKKNLKESYLIIASIFLLLATFAKLQYLMFAIISIVFLIEHIQKESIIKLIRCSLIQLIIVLPALLWYLWVMPTWEGNPILLGIFGGDVSISEYLKLIGFHATKMFPNKLLSFPMWLPFLIGIYSLVKKQSAPKWLYGLIGITILYLLLQLNAIGRAHDYYLCPFLPWLFVIIAFGIKLIKSELDKAKLVLQVICVAAILYSIYTTRTWGSLEITFFNKDVFVYSEELKQAVPDNELCIILNDHSNVIFSYQIDKMGYVFREDYLPVEWVDDMVRNKNVKYMYSDSFKINNNNKIKEYIEKTILKKGSVKVFKLKLPDV